MNKPKIKLIKDVPCTFTLENDTPREMSSKFSDGVEYMYSVTCQGEESILFLPVDGRIAMDRSNARAGDQVEITKGMQNNRAVYNVRVFSDAHLAVPAPPPPTPRAMPAPQPAAQPEGVRMLAPRSQVAPQPAPYAPVASTPAPVDGYNTALAKRCFFAAVDVLAATQTYAASQHRMELHFNEEDARALGITFLIGEQRSGR